MKVMIVDDDPAIIAIATLALATKGHVVVSAQTADAALALAATECPDAILLDVELGDDDGLALRAKFAAPVVMLTGRAGVDGIAKPFDPLTLADQLLVKLRAAR